MFAQLFGDGGDGGQTQVKRRRAARTSAPRVRDIEIVYSELRLLVAIRRTVRETEGRAPSTARIDEPLDERAGTRSR